ncbi:unnamed protein product [Cylicocyclus nassatus]|uniref:Uncharacterized protein n=1 Tax=Cylicocyclus nassatus TaxID=53992 RepID=A0AA36DM20_CYLNA|nr:unnamed protein product [Cylicocyclus nassatus]
MLPVLQYAIMYYHILLIFVILTAFCTGKRSKLPISPLKYDPDDPSTWATIDDTEKTSEQKAKSGKSSGKNISKSPLKSEVKTLLRAPNDMETVNDMVSAWGAVQEEQNPRSINVPVKT